MSKRDKFIVFLSRDYYYLSYIWFAHKIVKYIYIYNILRSIAKFCPSLKLKNTSPFIDRKYALYPLFSIVCLVFCGTRGLEPLGTFVVSVSIYDLLEEPPQ